jgi:tRNA splicing ligase
VYVAKLEEMKERYEGMYLKRGEGKDTLKTNEGVKAVDEAINELYEQTQLHELKEHDHLTELTNTFV